MTVFTRTWNAAYEAQPADVENISTGASRIRNFKSDVQERGEVDHFWAGDTQDGEHKKLTFGAPIASPANVANKGFLYGKDVSAKIELHYLDEDGNEVQLTSVGGATAFASTTSMLFYQSAAPTGWTKDTATFDNHALRVVSSTAWSAGSKGATAFDSVFSSSKATDATTLTAAHMEHKHEVPSGVNTLRQSKDTGVFSDSGNSRTMQIPSIGTTSESSNSLLSGGVDSVTAGGHTHTVSMDLNYINVIRATKD